MGSPINIAQHLNQFPIVEKSAATNERTFGNGCFTPVKPNLGSNFKPSIQLLDLNATDSDLAKAALAVLDLMPDEVSSSLENGPGSIADVLTELVKSWLNCFDTGIMGYSLMLEFAEPFLPFHNDMDPDEEPSLAEYSSAQCWLNGYLEGFQEKEMLIGSKMERIFSLCPLLAISVLRWMGSVGLQTTIPMLPEIQFSVVANGEELEEESEDGYSVQLFRKHYPDWAFDNKARARILNQQYQKQEGECVYSPWEMIDSFDLYLSEIGDLHFDLTSADGRLCNDVRDAYLAIATMPVHLGGWAQEWYHLAEPSCIIGWKDLELARRAADDFQANAHESTDVIFSEPLQNIGDLADVLESLKPGLEILTGYHRLLKILDGE